MDVPRGPLPPHPGALPARLGLAPRATRCGSPAWPPRPGCSRSSRPSTARWCGSRRSAGRPRSRSTCGSRAASPTSSTREGNPARPDVDRRAPGDGRPQHPPLRPARGPTRCDAVMEKPFAITLEVGSSLANKTGSWRVERPVYVDRLPPCNDACPAGENIQQWLYQAEDGSYEAAWRQIMRGQPASRRHGAGLLPPLPDGLQPGHGRRGGGDQRRRALPGRPGPRARAGRPTRRGPATGTPGPGGRLRARRPVGRLSPAPPRARGRRLRVVAAPGRHDALRHPRVPAAPGHRGGRDRADRVHGRRDRVRAHGRRPRGRPWTTGASTPPSWPSGPSGASTPTSPPGTRPASSTPSRCCATPRTTSRRSLGRRVVVYGGGDTAMDAARTARRLGAEDAVVVYRRTRERMPANDEEVQDAVDEGVRLKWLSTIVGAEGDGAHHRADGARRRRLPAAHRRVRGAAGGLAGPGARARRPTSRCCGAMPDDRGGRRARPGRART